MIDATIDCDGSVRVCPGSTASLRVVRDGGWLTVANVGDRPAVLNGNGVLRHGQDRYYLGAGRVGRFPPRDGPGIEATAE